MEVALTAALWTGAVMFLTVTAVGVAVLVTAIVLAVKMRAGK
jgi:hypothetical protein